MGSIRDRPALERITDRDLGGVGEEEDITLKIGATIYWVLTTRQALVVYYLI